MHSQDDPNGMTPKSAQAAKDYVLLTPEMAVKCDNDVNESLSTKNPPKPMATGLTISG
jgi:hypothetical protein